MFGIPDVSVALAYFLVILLTLVSVVYGILNWNRGEASEEGLETEARWMKEEIELEETLDGGVNP